VEAIESKKIDVKLEKVDLSVVLKNILDMYENAANKKMIKIDRLIEVAVNVNADKNYVDRVLENLISNAIKFSPFEKNIFITLSKENGYAICQIRDEGPGLTENDKKNLFGKYQKLSAKPTDNESSTGLGLSIVKKFVDAMNAEIFCESEEGKGASFFLKFDLISFAPE
jgi:signal transduction histidine kinase